MTTPSTQSGALAAAVMALVVACDDGDGQAELPPDEAPALLDDDDDLPFDDDDSAPPLDDTPDHVLTVVEAGRFERSPEGGPYTALTGFVEHVELWNGRAPPDADDPQDPGGPPGLEGPNCRLAYAVVAVPAPADPACPGCAEIWSYTASLDSGDPRWCLAPSRLDLDIEGRFGWSPGDQAIYIDHEGLGVWLFEYAGLEDEDALDVAWTGEFGFTPPEMD